MRKAKKVPFWLKAIGVKWWFAGAVCYFVVMGLGHYFSDGLDVLVLSGLLLGAVTDILAQPILRALENIEGESKAFMLFPFPVKAVWTLFCNLAYYLALVFAVNGVYTLLNMGKMLIGIEPLLFATLAVGLDFAVIGVKNLLARALRKRRKSEV